MPKNGVHGCFHRWRQVVVLGILRPNGRSVPYRLLDFRQFQRHKHLFLHGMS